MSEDSLASGWYFTKQDIPSKQQTGPFSWEQMRALADAGALTSADLVWHPTMPEWLPAEQVAGLLPAKAGPARPPSESPVQGASLEPGAAASRRRLLLVLAIALLIALAGAILVFMLTEEPEDDVGVAGAVTVSMVAVYRP